MKVRPILYSTEMVQAIKDGRKTQTRRLIKSHPANVYPEDECWQNVSHAYEKYRDEDRPDIELPAAWLILNEDNDVEYLLGQCPYGDPGDVLYVRETYYAYGYWITNGVTETGKHKYMFVDLSGYSVWQDKGLGYRYFDNPPDEVLTNSSLGKMGYHKRPSLFMPKAAARYFQKIKRRWIERLNDISEADAIAEGCSKYGPFGEYRGGPHPSGGGMRYRAYSKASRAYQCVWEYINGEGSWAANPFVWCVEFELTENPEL